MDRYNIICKVGEGAFGVVLKAEDLESNKIVALKQIPLKNVEDGILPDAVIREIQALRNLKHENILKLFSFFPKFPGITLVLEYMPSNLSKVIKRHRKAKEQMPEAHVKSYMLMLLKGVYHLHSHKVMHRDLKPKNLLMSRKARLKIGDFGLARVINVNHNKSYTNQVSTRWYKSPELLYGNTMYDESIDMWAVGCIFAELMTCSPFFEGQSDIDQLSRIFGLCGTPSESSWPGLSQLPDYGKIIFDDMPRKPLESVIPHASPSAISLLDRLLVVCPRDRLTALQALNDPYFTIEPLPAPLSSLLNP